MIYCAGRHGKRVLPGLSLPFLENPKQVDWIGRAAPAFLLDITSSLRTARHQETARTWLITKDRGALKGYSPVQHMIRYGLPGFECSGWRMPPGMSDAPRSP